MIVRNEEANLGPLLASASQFCDELIVIDTGSTDQTAAVAAMAGAVVAHFPWIDDFAAARNYSFSHCTSDWILWLDADDILTPECIAIGKEIKEKLLPKMGVDFIFTPYDYAFNELNGEVTLQQMRERFMRRSAKPVWRGRVHETICDISTKFVVCPEFKIQHKPTPVHYERKKGRNLAILEQYVDPKTSTNTRDLYQYGGELRGEERFEEAIACYKRYQELWPKDEGDLFQEPYCVFVDMIDSYRRLGRAREAVEACGQAIALDASRAEAYALMAMTHYELENWAAAFTLFLAAAACKPPKHGGVVYSAFYSSAIHDMIKECKQRLEAKT